INELLSSTGWKLEPTICATVVEIQFPKLISIPLNISKVFVALTVLMISPMKHRGQRSAVSGQRSVVSGQPSVVSRQLK
ncbi:MAG: hypothetical protein F6K26_57605, partial [Moorea sp. SIO2I5]|nr:hypothetical protein [Moorena sp. SIO2I5]